VNQRKKNEKELQIYIFTWRERAASPFAPATIQVVTSLFILATTVGTEDSKRSKTQAFLSSQSSHMTSMVRGRVPCLGVSVVVLMLIHHCRAVALAAQLFGSRFSWPSQWATRVHTLLEYRQEDSRWCAVSIVFRQRGQVGLWSQFLHASLSEVHTLFWSISHAKKLHFGGHVF
jgi:hypothetical protein